MDRHIRIIGIIAQISVHVIGIAHADYHDGHILAGNLYLSHLFAKGAVSRQPRRHIHLFLRPLYKAHNKEQSKRSGKTLHQQPAVNKLDDHCKNIKEIH